MPQTNTSFAHLTDIAGGDGVEVRRQEALLKTGALQNAIFKSATFPSIATEKKDVIQTFKVGAERMLGKLTVTAMCVHGQRPRVSSPDH